MSRRNAFLLLLQSQGFPAPGITSPTAGQLLDTTSPTFVFNAPPGSTQWTLHISLSSTFGTTELDVTFEDGDAGVVVDGSEVSYTIQTPLDPADGTHYWRVSAVGGTWSAVQSFEMYLLYDRFTTDDAAPVASPRTCEPIGTLTFVQDDGEMSISSAVLNFPAQTTPSGGDQGFYSHAIARGVGRALLGTIRLASGSNIVFGWNQQASAGYQAANRELRLFVGGSFLLIYNQAQSLVVHGAGLATATDYQLAAVTFATGGAILIKGGTFTNWTIIWVGETGTTATLYAALTNDSANGTLDNLRVVPDVGGVFDDRLTLAFLNDTTLADDDTFTGTAAGLSQLEFTLNGSPSADEEAASLIYRRQDADNYWRAYIKRNAGNTAWDFLLDSVAAGTPTNRVTVTGVATPDAIRIVHRGNLHRCFTRAGTTFTLRGSEVNNSAHAAQTGMAVGVAAGTTLSRLLHWADALAAYDVLDDFLV